MTRTHISDSGCLYKVKIFYTDINDIPNEAIYRGYGRLVNPNGNYVDAPRVQYFWVHGVGCVVLK